MMIKYYTIYMLHNLGIYVKCKNLINISRSPNMFSALGVTPGRHDT